MTWFEILKTKRYHKENWGGELEAGDLDAFLWGHVMHCIMQLEDEIDEDNMFDKVMECMRSKQQKGELQQGDYEDVSPQLLESWSRSPYQRYWIWSLAPTVNSLLQADAIEGWPQEVKDKLVEIGEEEEKERKEKETRLQEEQAQQEETQNQNTKIERFWEKDRHAREGMGPGRRRGRKFSTTRGPARKR